LPLTLAYYRPKQAPRRYTGFCDQIDVVPGLRPDCVECSSAMATDEFWLRGDRLVDLALGLERVGRMEAATDALRDAVALYERKGSVDSTARAGAVIEGLTKRAAIREA
jgi:hypothetical protein